MTIKTLHKQNKGITLVALVITIIVLIILAAVSINAVMNEGLIQNAKDASEKWESASDAEQLELAKIEGMLAAETLKEVKAGEYTGTENKKYVQGEKTAIIPAGFTVSNVKTDTLDETTIAGGLVIYAGDHSAVTDMTTVQGTANQYVWIPVDNPSDIYGTLESEVEGIEGKKFGKLYFKTLTEAATHHNWPTETGYSKTSYREPSVLTSYDTDAKYYKDILGYNSLAEYKAGMEKEFSDMITSVEKYKGFYIGRYELTGTASAPTVKKGLSPLASTSWYDFYNACTNLEKLEDGSINDNVTTSMIWGFQWDQAVKKCLIFDDKFLTDNSAKYGVFTGNGTSGVQVSGTKDAAYNIYDMGGNVLDWTLEVGSKWVRTSRGGDYFSSSTDYPASYRKYNGPSMTGYEACGCRPQLYIK